MKMLSTGRATLLESRARLAKLAYSLTDQVFTVGIPFLVNMLLARSVSKSEYGQFTLLYSAYTFISGFHNACILEPLVVFGTGQFRDRFSAYFRYLGVRHVVFSCSISLLIACGAFGIHRFFPAYYSSAEYALALAVFFLLSGGLLRQVCYAQHSPQKAVALTSIFAAVVLVFTVVLKTTGRLNAFAVFIIISLGWLATSPLLPSIVDWRNSRHFHPTGPTYWRLHWGYARWVLATAFVFQLMNQAYYWMLAVFGSTAAVADFKAAHNLVKPVELFFIALALLALPVLTRAYSAGDRRTYQRRTLELAGFSTAVAVTAAVLLNLAGRPLLHLIYGGAYDNAFHILQILSLVPCLTGIGNALNDSLKSALRPDAVFIAYAVAGIGTLALGIPMVKAWGNVGAAWGMVVSAMLYTSILIGFQFRNLRRSFPNEIRPLTVS